MGVATQCSAGGDPRAGRRLIAKDLFHVAGEPTLAGCDSPLQPLVHATAPDVLRPINASAIYIVKAQVVQLAFGGWGY